MLLLSFLCFGNKASGQQIYNASSAVTYANEWSNDPSGTLKPKGDYVWF
jgi:hypothetical protein